MQHASVLSTVDELLRVSFVQWPAMFLEDDSTQSTKATAVAIV